MLVTKIIQLSPYLNWQIACFSNFILKTPSLKITLNGSEDNVTCHGSTFFYNMGKCFMFDETFLRP